MEINLGEKKIGDGHRVFFVAEAGVNHNGSLEMAMKLIDVAVESGADAVKFQTFRANEVNTKNAPKASYHVETTGTDEKETWHNLLKKLEMSEEMHHRLFEYCNQKKIMFLSTPYGEESADFLEKLNIKLFKIASTDTNNLPFLRFLAKKKKPMIVSTGMSTFEEVETAVNVVKKEGLKNLVLLQCTGNYPANIVNSNLRVMKTYREKLNCLVGLSDHTSELINPIASTALGACVIEKHITLDRNLFGPDHRMSLNPKELRLCVQAIRDTEKALGSEVKTVLPGEEGNRKKLRKSIVAKENIKSGEKLNSNLITFKRPGTGIPPSCVNEVLGRVAKKDIATDTILDHEMFEK